MVGDVYVEPGERPLGGRKVGGLVDVAEEFLGDPGGVELTVGVSGFDTGEETIPAGLVQPA